MHLWDRFLSCIRICPSLLPSRVLRGGKCPAHLPPCDDQSLQFGQMPTETPQVLHPTPASLWRKIMAHALLQGQQAALCHEEQPKFRPRRPIGDYNETQMATSNTCRCVPSTKGVCGYALPSSGPKSIYFFVRPTQLQTINNQFPAPCFQNCGLRYSGLPILVKLGGLPRET